MLCWGFRFVEGPALALDSLLHNPPAFVSVFNLHPRLSLDFLTALGAVKGLTVVSIQSTVYSCIVID